MMEQLLEYFGVLTGLLYLFLEIRQHRAMWVVGFLTSLVYVFVFFFSKIYADMGLNIYYVAISIYGFWQWTRSKGRQEQTAEDIETAPQEVILYRNMTLRLFAGISFSIVALFALLYYVLHYFTDSPIPAGDAFTTAVGIVATWMLARRIVEHWIFWIVVNCVMGIELTGGVEIARWLDWSGNLTLSRNKIKNFIESIEVYDADWNFLREDHNDLGTTDIAFSPDIIANSMFNFSWKQFSASFNSQFVGRQYIDNTSCKDRSIDPYFVSNLRVGYVFKPKFMKEIALDVTINNLFNEQYETNAWVYSAMVDGERYKEDGYFTQAGTNAMARVTFKF